MSCTLPDCPECKLGEELNYQAYKAHREDYPDVPFAHWSQVFRDVERWEKRYLWEKMHAAPVKPGIFRSWSEAWHSWGWMLAAAACVVIWWVVFATAWKLWPR